ncbi:AmpG family muropeptide MFS transporter [Microbaculum marinum]|uniref:MFS transporter n=1 Tax=Microbaculum marinum TaxID=1764581 RepID=A0AAW9RTS1_9HYPH
MPPNNTSATQTAGSPPPGSGAHKPLGERLAAAFAVFFQRRVLIILFLGFSSGLPLALSGSTLAIRMTDVGVDLGTIGLFSLAGLPYTIKFLWAPLVDAIRIPVLSRLLGRRRGWLIFSQILLMAAIVYLGFTDPVAAPWFVALGALLVAAASATQDIVIDAFRVESLKTEEQAAGMAWFVSAYRVGMLVSTAGCVAMVAWLEASGVDTTAGWSWAYAAMACLVLIGAAAALFGLEPTEPEGTATDENPITRVGRTAVDAFSEFLMRKDAIVILAFVVLYKFCDAFAGVMTGPFVITIGFDKAAYAGIVKGVGLFAVLAGGFAGGLMLKAVPMVTMLWIAGFLQMASNLVFSWQAIVGVNNAALAVTIAVENFTGGIGTVIFVAYISGLCNDARHTATQFALLTALAAVGRTVLSAQAGYAAEAVGWVTFFGITALAGIPGLLLLWWLQMRGHFAERRER